MSCNTNTRNALLLDALASAEHGANGPINIEHARTSFIRTRGTRMDDNGAETTYAPYVQERIVTPSTMLFLPRRHLEALSHSGETLVTQVEDTVESFLWIFLYALMRRLSEDDVGDSPRERKSVKDAYTTTFGCTSTKDICLRRTTLHFALLAGYRFVQKVVPYPIVQLLIGYGEHMSDQLAVRALTSRMAPETSAPRPLTEEEAAYEAKVEAALEAAKKKERKRLAAGPYQFTHSAMCRRLADVLERLQLGREFHYNEVV